MEKNELIKLNKKLRNSAKCNKEFQIALIKKKKQASIDNDFKRYIKSNYPEIYKDVVIYLIKKYKLNDKNFNQ